MKKCDVVYVLYDGACPLCRNYCRMLRLRDAVGEVKFVDARQPSNLLDEVSALEMDIDRGMVVKIGNAFFSGADAVHMLALLSSKSGVFNRVIAQVFQFKILALILYPLLRGMRALVLWGMGIPMIKKKAGKR